jgi:hypothetical protein
MMLRAKVTFHGFETGRLRALRAEGVNLLTPRSRNESANASASDSARENERTAAHPERAGMVFETATALGSVMA